MIFIVFSDISLMKGLFFSFGRVKFVFFFVNEGFLIDCGYRFVEEG